MAVKRKSIRRYKFNLFKQELLDNYIKDKEDAQYIREAKNLYELLKLKSIRPVLLLSIAKEYGIL